jgi:hypothetical protein
MDTYSRKFELDQYCVDPEQLAARENYFEKIILNKKKGSKK